MIQNEAKYKTLLVKKRFYIHDMTESFFVSIASHLVSLGNRGCGNCLLSLLRIHLYSVSLDRLYTTVTVKCCSLVSPITVALFTGPSLSSEHVTQDFSASRDSERYPGDSLGRDSESSDSETEEKEGERNGRKGVVFKLDDWIALSASQEVISFN